MGCMKVKKKWPQNGLVLSNEPWPKCDSVLTSSTICYQTKSSSNFWVFKNKSKHLISLKRQTSLQEAEQSSSSWSSVQSSMQHGNARACHKFSVTQPPPSIPLSKLFQV